MKLQKIEFDWTGQENWGFCTTYEVGKNGVVKLGAHYPQGEGDKLYCIVEFEDGHTETKFNINSFYCIP